MNNIKSIYNNTLLEGFINNVSNRGDAFALHCKDTYYTYHDLFNLSVLVSNHLTRNHQSEQHICILGKKDSQNYVGLLGILLAGKTYVPLNLIFPSARNQKIIELSQATTVIVTEDCFAESIDIFKQVNKKLNIIVLTNSNEKLLSIHDHHIAMINLMDATEPLITPLQRSENAYLLFTSGSTGTPKGVVINHAAVLHYLRNIMMNYHPSPKDHFCHLNELTFDLSVHELFLCWTVGGCLYVSLHEENLQFIDFANRFKITFALIVPSFVQMLMDLRKLKENSLPTLTHTFFCGEPLLYQQASRWQLAAKNSVLINLYGPTEATIAFTHYVIHSWDHDPYQIVPIGIPFAGNDILISAGELCVAGSQVIKAYWYTNSADDKFLSTIDHGNKTTWYRTGDIVKKDENDILHYLTRIDRQVKIQGYRVELGEIEQVISRITSSFCAVVTDKHAFGVDIVAFSMPSHLAMSDILNACAKLLPAYMMPTRIIFLTAMPHNANGKVDYLALAKMVNEDDQ